MKLNKKDKNKLKISTERCTSVRKQQQQQQRNKLVKWYIFKK